jgi:4-hydroxy-tetrahydrodipicolinate reductase
MRVGVFGAGRLAQAILAEAERMGKDKVEIAWALHRDQKPSDIAGGQNVDVAIDASSAAGVPAHIEWAIAQGVPLVIGTTNWEMPGLAARVGNSTALLVAPNFSFGISLVRRMARMIGFFASQDTEAEVAIFEHHHSAKQDSPSGTAKSLANAVLGACPRYEGWTLGPHAADKLDISVMRTGSETGYHEIILDSPFEQIKVSHRARDRRLFAIGALKTAGWIRGRKGLFTMDDVVGDLLGEGKMTRKTGEPRVKDVVAKESKKQNFRKTESALRLGA